MEIKFVPLSFINTNEEILKQIKNTVLISYLFDQYQETTLESYLDSTQYGYTASALENGKHKLVRITDINDGNVNWDTVPFCDCDVEDKYLLKDNDILVARTGGTTGKSFIVNNPPNNAVFASYLIRLRLNAKADIEFITYFLNSYAFWSQIIEMKAGSAMPNVNAEKLKSLKLPKCDLRIQKEIISIFNNSINTNGFQSLFDKVASVEQLFLDNKSLSTELTHQLTLVKKLRQQLLQDAVQGKLVAQDPGDEPAGELLKRIKAEKQKLIADKSIKQGKIQEAELQEELLFDIPDNWIWTPLDDISKNITDGTHQTPIYTRSGRMFLSAQNIKPFKFMPDEHKFVSEETYNEIIRNRKPEYGDILIARVGAGIGEAAVIDKDIDFCFYVSLGLVQPIKKYINSDYITLVINSPYGVKYSKGNISSKGGSAGNFNLGRIRSFLIPLPPLSEQRRIVQKLEELMGMCDGLEGSIRESMEQNERLLQQVLREALRGVEKEKVEINLDIVN